MKVIFLNDMKIVEPEKMRFYQVIMGRNELFFHGATFFFKVFGELHYGQHQCWRVSLLHPDTDAEKGFYIIKI